MQSEEIKRIIHLSNKISDKMDVKKGVFTLEFQNGNKFDVKIITNKINTDLLTSVDAYIITFNDDIDKTTRYELSQIKDAY